MNERSNRMAMLQVSVQHKTQVATTIQQENTEKSMRVDSKEKDSTGYDICKSKSSEVVAFQNMYMLYPNFQMMKRQFFFLELENHASVHTRRNDNKNGRNA